MEVNMNSVTGFPQDTIYPHNLKINPVVLIIIVLILIFYFTIFSKYGKSSGDIQGSGDSGSMRFLAIILWGIFVILLILNGASYFYNINITARLHDLLTDKPEVDIVVDQPDIAPIPEIKIKKQVFHIPDNKYNYKDAKAICQAYGGKLASWKQINKAYKKGADWCGYGWSEDQMALYPTQYKKWKNLQNIEGHEHDCGRPGINGGYIANPNVKFGINCYGYKPKITPDEADAMKMAPLYPRTRKELAFEKRVDYWRNQLPNINISPFNHNMWSSI